MWCIRRRGDWGRFKNVHELVNLRALKSYLRHKLHIFSMYGIDIPLIFHTNYRTRALKYTIFIQCWKFKSSQIYELGFETPPGLADWVAICQRRARSCVGVTYIFYNHRLRQTQHLNWHKWPGLYIFFALYLTNYGRVTHICVGNLTIVGSDNGLSPGQLINSHGSPWIGCFSMNH